MEAGPGLSLFQGSDSIQLNAAAQRLEEDEEQEDKKRRDEEVHAFLLPSGKSTERRAHRPRDISLKYRLGSRDAWRMMSIVIESTV